MILPYRVSGVALVVTLALLPLAKALPASTFAPAAVIHALYLQTTGVLADTASVEPCSTAGIADSVRRADAAFENRDFLTMQVEQDGYSRGFARCALNAANAEDFATFAAACTQSGRDAILAYRAVHHLGLYEKVKAQQFYIISRWLISDRHADVTSKSIAKQVIDDLRTMKAI